MFSESGTTCHAGLDPASRSVFEDWILAFASMTEEGELEVGSIGTTQGRPLRGALCAVDVLVYRVHPEKLSAHGDVRRSQIPNITVQPIDFLGKVQLVL